MTSRKIPLLLVCLSLSTVGSGCAGGKPSVDFGDRSTGNLLWGASHYRWENRDLDKSLAYADKALELHGAEARKMQASLSDFPVTDPPGNVFKYNTLNNVALTTLVKGETLLEKGDQAGAAEAFTMVIRDFGYAQAQDLGEWGDYVTSVPRDAKGFVKLADVAKQRLADIKAGQN